MLTIWLHLRPFSARSAHVYTHASVAFVGLFKRNSSPTKACTLCHFCLSPSMSICSTKAIATTSALRSLEMLKEKYSYVMQEQPLFLPKAKLEVYSDI